VLNPEAPETFTDEERARLTPYFTNLDTHVFALTNLPETVKGALFARYSRSSKSLRRLFLDEFADKVTGESVAPEAVGVARAEKLFARVFSEYGDDSVAQLGGAHIACEYVSNVLTKVLEWGRLMAYLEQSTRYVPYTDRLLGRWRYHVPAELEHGALRDRYVRTMDDAFERYAKWIPEMQRYFERRYPKSATDPDAVHRAAIRAKALDTLRGMLPASTQSNVGIYGTGQAFEALLLRMRSSPLTEVRACAAQMLAELRKVIPAFLTRVDQPDRGDVWSRYLADTRLALERQAAALADVEPERRDEVSLTDFDPDGEVKVVAAALYAATELADDQLLAIARRMSPDERLAVLRASVGRRSNRRHRPGRAWERTCYRFDVLTDYGAFRDLQRHRLLTLEWQPLTTRHGFTEPEAISEAGAGDDWNRVMDGSAALLPIRCRWPTGSASTWK
jgi:thymidylate synthase ThyX